MRFRRMFRAKKPRKYPIERDSQGRSLRARCFQRFDEGMRPVEVAKEEKMKKATVDRYFQDWKQIGPDFERKLTYVRGLLKQSAPARDRNLELFARAGMISKEELEIILAKPNGLRRLMTGKLHLPGQARANRRLAAVLQVALAIDDYLIKHEKTFEDIRFAFEGLLSQNMESRKAEDAEIEEENLEIAFARKVLEVAAIEEQEGRPKRDRLTAEERDAVIKYGLEAKLEQKLRGLETDYWLRVAVLMAEGLTQEQARGKIYQDLVDKGDLEGARIMRQYQDTVHPLKTDNQSKPISPPPPPPSQE